MHKYSFALGGQTSSAFPTIHSVYVFLVSANTMSSKRVNAHAERREQSTSVLDNSLKFADFEQQESKVDVQCLMSHICCYVTIRSRVLG